MNLHLELTEADLKKLILDEINERLNGLPVTEHEIRIEVKSKQNYKSEWEAASFRASVNYTTRI